ncbi:MAG: DUF2723 domain-containing protein [Rikenellaceae bacterium]
MTQFRKYSLIIGWVVFAIAMLTYGLTVESAASLWDCPEFIATSYKLEVGHPPGTPLFFLINRIGAMFAGSPENVGYAINMLSALESALCIAFLFWTIANLARKIYRKRAEELTQPQVLTTMVAATIGSLAYAFTDTFWFSAVEAEVYALSSLFTAIVVWAMFRWESVADSKDSTRWLIFISYMMGLSIGAHILNLLAIPALVFIYYFRKFPAKPYKRLWKPAAVGVALTGIFYSLTPTVVSIGAFVDRIFVNSFGAPVNMGLTVFIILVLAALAYGIYYTIKAKKEGWNTILISAMMVVIGFSTYGVVLIRSSVNPSMNSNQPDNPYALLSFLNREQYGSRPLIWGQSYASTPEDYIYSDSYYVDEDGKYKKYSYVSEIKYDDATTMFFPRMYSDSHKNQYKAWGATTGRKVKNSRGEFVTVPTFGENLGFFFGYQMNHMYWRYFLWNFVGRQNDMQNDGPTTGNWLSGITFIDEMFFGPQDNLPPVLANNKGRNTYYFLPLILGLIGFFFSLKRDGKGFLIISLLFFMTGIAIILYLNQTPSQPRERDYAYAASFYAFCIWIGLGAMALCEKLRKSKVPAKAAVAIGFVLSASVPLILVAQNWDDHDRSGRTIARDMGWNYLTSVAPENAIFINFGDNDTFPVWYAQEVEEIRPDVRVMNASYISGDWYIDQMRIKSNESEALPITLPRSKYKGKSSPTFIVDDMKHPSGKVWTAKEVMSVVNSDASHTKLYTQGGEAYDLIPSSRIALPVNKENVLKSGIVKPEDMHLVEDTIYLQLKDKYLGIGDMILLDIIANNDWTRPIYFTSAAGASDLGLVGYSNNNAFSYLQQDGAAYRLVPIRHSITKNNSTARIDTELLYDNLINKFEYGGLKDGVYVDQFVRNVFTTTQFRNTFAQLAYELSKQGDSTRAIEVLDRAMLEMPTSALGYDDQLLNIINEYYANGAYDKANALVEEFIEEMIAEINYYSSFTSASHKSSLSGKIDDSTHNLYTLLSLVEGYNQIELLYKYAYLFEGDAGM